MNLNALGAVVGREWPETVQLSQDYFLARGCFIDTRGPLEIDENSTWGFGVKVITQSHALDGGDVGAVIDRPVVVKADAWIGSFSLLYNCIIGAGSVVAAGSVVRSCEIGPGVMVAGNPARKIAVRDDNGQWVYLNPKWRKVMNWEHW